MIMRRSSIFFLIAITFFSTGCSKVAIYSDPDLKKETGVKFFTPKPYILVAHSNDKDKTVNVSVVYLPDLKNPMYAKTISGLGSANLSLAFNANGTLSSLGQATDPKIAELIGSLGTAILAPGIGALKDVAVEGIKKSTATQTALISHGGEDTVDIGLALEQAATFLEKKIENNESVLDGTAIQKATLAIRDIKAQAARLKDPHMKDTDRPDVIEKLNNILDNYPSFPDPTTPDPKANAVFQQFADTRDAVKTAIKVLTGPQPGKEVYELYEIDNNTSPATLKRVRII